MLVIDQVVENYVQSLYNLSNKQKKPAESLQDLKKFGTVFLEHDKLLDTMKSPITPFSEKAKILDSLNKKLKTSELVFKFVSTLIENYRIEILAQVIDLFERKYNNSKNVKIAYVESAKALKAQEEKALQKYVEKHLGGKALLRISINPEIIGGFRIRYDSNLLDLSTLGAIESINQQLLSDIQ